MNLFDSQVASSHASVQSMSSVDAIRRAVLCQSEITWSSVTQTREQLRLTRSASTMERSQRNSDRFRLKAVAIRQRTRHLVKRPQLEDHKWLNIENIERGQIEWQNPTDTRVFDQDKWSAAVITSDLYDDTFDNAICVARAEPS